MPLYKFYQNFTKFYQIFQAERNNLLASNFFTFF